MKQFSARAAQNVGSLNAVANVVTTATDQPDEAVINVSGTFVGTLTFQGSFDNTTWVPIGVTDVVAGTTVGTTTAVGTFRTSMPLPFIRVQMTAYTSGTAVVTAAASISRYE